jgi:hypothetical protein
VKRFEYNTGCTMIGSQRHLQVRPTKKRAQCDRLLIHRVIYKSVDALFQTAWFTIFRQHAFTSKAITTSIPLF